MNPINAPLNEIDPEIHDAIENEERRQSFGLELIASENFTSRAVLEATGSVFTNKYAEGYPGRRYYGGCEFVDVVESLAIERAKKLFGAEHVERPAALRQPGQHVGVPDRPEAGRHRPGDESFAWRASDARASAELLRQVLQHRAVWRAKGH